MEKSTFKPETNIHPWFFKSKAQIWIIKLQLTETYKQDIETFLGLHDEFILLKPKLWVPKNSKIAKGKRQELGLGSLSIEQKNKTNGKTQRNHKELGLLIW